MGLQQKLERAHDEGFQKGLKANQELVETRGFVKGAQATWEVVERMFTDIEGIGPKTKEKILLAVKAHASKERKKFLEQRNEAISK